MDEFHTDAFKATEKSFFWVIFLQKPTKVFEKTKYLQEKERFFLNKKLFSQRIS